MNHQLFSRLVDGKLQNGRSVNPGNLLHELFAGTHPLLITDTPRLNKDAKNNPQQVRAAIDHVNHACRNLLCVSPYVKGKAHFMPHFHADFPRGFALPLSLDAKTLRSPAVFFQALGDYIAFLADSNPMWIEEVCTDKKVWDEHLNESSKAIADMKNQRLRKNVSFEDKHIHARLRGQCGEFVLRQLVQKFLTVFDAQKEGISILDTRKQKLPVVSERFSLRPVPNKPFNVEIQDALMPHGHETRSEYDLVVLIDDGENDVVLFGLDSTTSPYYLRTRKLRRSGELMHEMREDVRHEHASGPDIHHLPIAFTPIDSARGYSRAHQIHNKHDPLMPIVVRLAEKTAMDLGIA